MKRFAVLGFLLLVLVPWNLYAQQRYVSDVLYIPVRTGASNQHRIIRHIKSGTEVTLLSRVGDDSEYVKIRVNDDDKATDGYVKERYLLEEPIAAIKLVSLQKRFEELRNREPLARTVDDLKQQLADLKQSNAQLEAAKQEALSDLERLKQVVAKPAEVFEKNKQLMAEQKALEERLKVVETENLKLETDQRNEGIKLGLVAVCLGGLAGFLLPYLKPRGRQQRSIRLH